MHDELSTTPGALIGVTKYGKPIYLLGGGSQPVGEPPADPTPPPAPADPPPATPPTPTEDIAALPEWAQTALRSARAEAAKSRTTAKQTAADQARQEVTAQIAKALGLAPDEPVDPAKLTEQIEQAQAAAWRSGVELQVHRSATRLGADAETLLDSRAFIDTLDDLVGEDPASPDFAKQLEAKVQEAMAKYPTKFKAAGQVPTGPTAPRPDPSQGAKAPGAPRRPASLHEAVQKAVAASKAPGG